VRAALWVAKVVIHAGLFIGVGGAFFRAWIADPGSSVGVRPLAAIVAAGLVATLVSVGLQGLDALALPPSDLRQQFVWRSGLATSYGATAIVAGIALLAGLFSLVATSAPAAGACALVALAGLGLAPVLSGHAATAPPRFITAPALFLHGIGVAFWIGALLPLALALRQGDAGRTALVRFSRVIPYPLALIVVTGGALAVVQLGRLDALWTTSYGLVLAGKLSAVLALLALAALNRYALVPRFEAVGTAAARPLARSIACELLIAVAILALVALWRFTPPPRALLATAPISLHLHGQQAMAQIELMPARGQGARVSLQVLDGAFQPLAAKEVALVLANAAAGIEPLRRAAVHAGDSNWRIDDLRIPVAGSWRLRVEILVTDFDKVMLEQTVALPRVP
jgi:copper transport protein